MKEVRKTAILFMITLGLLLVSSSPGLASTMGCTDNYYDAERGCQVSLQFEYITTEKEAMEVAALTGCPSNFYDAERGCQIPVISEYVPEYELVKEEIGKPEMLMGCPKDYFDAEKGCQIFVP